MKNPYEEELEEGSYQKHTYTVDPGQSPLRIDRFLIDKVENASRSKLQLGIKIGSITVNGLNVKSNYKVRPGDLIVVIMPKPEDYESEVIPEDIPLDVVYEDDDVLVVNKEAGLVVHPGIGNYRGTLVNALAYYLKDLPIKEGNLPNRPGLVHRIDKETSGLLVIAKSEKAMVHLAKQFSDHTIERTYLALCWGDVPEQGTIDKPLARHPKNRLLMHAYDSSAEHAKHAVTHYKCIENLYYVSLVQCNLETGRTHQIRVHMASEGHPIFADVRYGGDKIIKGTVFSKYKQFVDNCFKIIRRQALHAKSLGFVHPTTGEKMFFEAPMPEDMLSVLEKWRNYVVHKRGDAK